MSEILKFIGSAVVAIMLLAIPALFVLAITNVWHPFLILLISVLLILDFTLVATTIENMGDYDE